MARSCCRADSTCCSRLPPAPPLIDGTRRRSSCSRSRRENERRSSKAEATPAMSRPVTSCTPSTAALFAVAFDAQRLEVTGSPVPMVEGVRRVRRTTDWRSPLQRLQHRLAHLHPWPDSSSSGHAELALTDRQGRGRTAETPAWSVRGRRACLQTARASPSGPMTARRRSSRSMTCPARARCSDSRSEGTTAFRSGPRTASASRFSPIARATSPSSGSPPTGAPPNASRSPNRANHMRRSRGHPKADTLLFSVTKGSDVSLWTFSLQDRKATPFGDVHSSYPTGAVFSPDGRWVAYTSTRTGQDNDLRPAIPSHGSQVSASREAAAISPHKSLWSPDGKELFYDPRPGGIRGRQRHDATDVCLRECRAGAETIPNRARQTCERLRHHTRRQVRGSDPSGTNGVRHAHRAPQIQVVLNWQEELKQRVPTR